MNKFTLLQTLRESTSIPDILNACEISAALIEYQDKTLKELDDLCLKQQATIEQLREQIVSLTKRLKLYRKEP